MQYTFDELRAMSDEELRQISLERNKKGSPKMPTRHIRYGKNAKIKVMLV